MENLPRACRGAERAAAAPVGEPSLPEVDGGPVLLSVLDGSRSRLAGRTTVMGTLLTHCSRC